MSRIYEITERPIFAPIPNSLRDFADAVRHLQATPTLIPDPNEPAPTSYCRYRQSVRVTLEAPTTHDSDSITDIMVNSGSGEIWDQVIMADEVEMSIATDRVYFWTGIGGIAIEYPAIVLHAISRDPICLYMQLEERALEETGSSSMVEIRVFPAQPDIDEMFMALSECAALHPDQQHAEEDGEYEVSDDDIIHAGK
jgi:hypothetical protein